MKIKKILKQNKKSIVIVIIILTMLLTGIIINSSSKTKIEAETMPSSQNYIKVMIEGNVNYPDEYYVPSYTKVKELIKIAGGVSENGDTSLLYLEKVLDAGEIVYVRSKNNDNKKININNASIDILKKELKLTNTQANNLVMYRSLNGKFKNVYDLLKVDGFKVTTINEIINDITL